MILHLFTVKKLKLGELLWIHFTFNLLTKRTSEAYNLRNTDILFPWLPRDKEGQSVGKVLLIYSGSSVDLAPP